MLPKNGIKAQGYQADSSCNRSDYLPLLVNVVEHS